jgi:hypothetical protein
MAPDASAVPLAPSDVPGAGSAAADKSCPPALRLANSAVALAGLDAPRGHPSTGASDLQ